MTEPPSPTDPMPTDPLALVYLDPLTDAPRHLFVRGPDGRPRPNPIRDEELRDRVQPHWRALRDAVAAEGVGAEGVGAEGTDVGRAWDTAEWIWNSEPLRRQRALNRERAEQAFAAALRLFEQRDGMA